VRHPTAKKKDGKKRANKSHSGIQAHKRQKKVLVPPLLAVPGIALQSWVNDRLPEMLWASLLISGLGREEALVRFREVAALVPELSKEKRAVRPTLSGLASLESDLLQSLLATIAAGAGAKKALSPLLLFKDLPAGAEWAKAIGQTPGSEDWERLKGAVLQVLNHQSQEATDCRWLRVLFEVLSGALYLQAQEQVREIVEYPNFGLPQKVRPTVRCIEGTIDGFSGQGSAWSRSFWNQCLGDTPCEPRHSMEMEWSPSFSTTTARIREVREALVRHERACLKTTDIDARHDAVFGLGAYSLALLDELLGMGNSTSILGRVGLRTLLELYITILFLKMRDDPNLWMAYRQYGSGQAKLAFLKLDDSTAAVPGSISVEIPSQLANEDRWLEFVPIDLGHWAARDLRRLSEDAGVKADYDRLYPWTSAFTHGNWAAVRNTCFDLCINPLHRLHRRLRPGTADLGDVVADGCDLVDKILTTIDGLYPGFASRVTLPESKHRAPNVRGIKADTVTSEAAPLASVQRELFRILDEFFRRATGSSAEDFAPLGSFSERIRREAEKIGQRGPQAFLYVHEALRVFYRRFASYTFSEAKSLPGLKLVLGGTSHFGEAQFNSVRKVLLYGDSILIPDPVFPWIESARAEERFRNVRFLEAAFTVLHLKPLVDADLPALPIVVVPSFEKSLEENDPTTQNQISLLITKVLSHYLGRRFESIDQLQDFAGTRESDFLDTVDRQKLFVAPGATVGQPLGEAFEQYVAEIEQWRSQSYRAAMKELPKGLVVLSCLIERLAPQYHLLENAQELSACPLIALPAPWHYYGLVSRFFAADLRANGYLDVEGISTLNSLDEPQHEWLGNVPINDLLELLANRENQEFRSGLNDLVSELRGSAPTALKRVTGEVCRGLMDLLHKHKTEIQTILEKYKKRLGDAHVQQYVTTGASYRLTLSPTLRDFGEAMVGQSGPGAEVGLGAKKDDAANSLLRNL